MFRNSNVHIKTERMFKIMRYEKLGQAISVPYNKDYAIEAKIKSNGKDTNSYTITLLLVDYDTEESWKIEEGIKAESEPKGICMCVTDSIEKLISCGYFEQYINRWEYRQSMLNETLMNETSNNDR